MDEIPDDMTDIKGQVEKKRADEEKIEDVTKEEDIPKEESGGLSKITGLFLRKKEKKPLDTSALPIKPPIEPVKSPPPHSSKSMNDVATEITDKHAFLLGEIKEINEDIVQLQVKKEVYMADIAELEAAAKVLEQYM